jgi:hypothetical protein
VGPHRARLEMGVRVASPTHSPSPQMRVFKVGRVTGNRRAPGPPFWQPRAELQFLPQHAEPTGSPWAHFPLLACHSVAAQALGERRRTVLDRRRLGAFSDSTRMTGCFSNPSYTVTVGAHFRSGQCLLGLLPRLDAAPLSGVITTRLPVGNYSVLQRH